MNTLFGIIYPEELKMPVQNIQVLIDSYHERQKTGLIRLGYAAEKQLRFIFKRGNLINTYLVTPEKWESLPPEHGMDWMLSAGDAYAKAFSISSFGLLITKLLIQARGEPNETLIPQKQISEYLRAASLQPEATLLHLTWKDAASAIFFAPSADPHFDFISQDVILDEIGNYKVLCEWNEPQCKITKFSPDLSVEAWQEYYIRSAFINICENILSRFEILTGRALVDSLVRLITTFSFRQNLDISISARRLTDREIFPSPQDAAQSYRLLLGEMFGHFSTVLGPRLHASTLRDVIKNLSERERSIIHNFNLLPKGYDYE